MKRILCRLAVILPQVQLLVEKTLGRIWTNYLFSNARVEIAQQGCSIRRRGQDFQLRTLKISSCWKWTKALWSLRLWLCLEFLFAPDCAKLAAHNSSSDCWKPLSVKKLAHVVGCQCLAPPHNIVLTNTGNPCIPGTFQVGDFRTNIGPFSKPRTVHFQVYQPN